MRKCVVEEETPFPVMGVAQSLTTPRLIEVPVAVGEAQSNYE